MKFNRRQWLQITGASLLVHSCNFLEKSPAQLSSGGIETIYSGYSIGEEPRTEAGLHIGSYSQNIRTPLPHEVHSTIHSRAHNLFFFISKLEDTSTLKTSTGELISFKAEEGNFFYGHAAYDEKRKVLYSTQAKYADSMDEHARKNFDGFIHVYSVPEMKLVDKFSSFGKDPHDMMIINGELVICNGGEDSNIAFIDIESRKLITAHHIKVPHLSLRHIEKVDDENFLIATLTREMQHPCPLYLLSREKGFKIFTPPENLDGTLMQGQLLSVLHHDGYAYTTCPLMNNVLVFKITGEFIGAHQIQNACNLTYSPRLDGVVVGTSKVDDCAKLIKVTESGMKVSDIGWAKGITGSHSLLVVS